MLQKITHSFFNVIINIDLWLMWLTLIGVFLLFTRWWPYGRGMLIVVAFFFIVIGISPVSLRLAANLEDRFSKPSAIPSHVVGAVLLGGSFDLPVTNERGFTCYNLRASRVIEFAQLAHKYPHLRLVFIGGGSGIKSEAELTKQLYEEMGIESSRILFEGKSKDTFQNAHMGYDLVKPQKDDVWLLVTSAFHMPRAMGLFRKAGWNVMAYPVDYHRKPSDQHAWLNLDFYRGLVAWHYAMPEWLGMIKNYWEGRSDELFPRSS